ncbi:hypothetical protein PVK06_041309 [Gossypium arboreum]|uniref:Terpene synthase N-terminal domain-containing protein n=1 Tax=Gossypium arboreum TaxID=29729 RepID=A0ABR0N7W1_GOSAR|nr:hypothetical protein PVK06_041309 [Gossypium arboreum]
MTVKAFRYERSLLDDGARGAGTKAATVLKAAESCCGAGKPRVSEVSIFPGHLGYFKIGPYCKMSLKFGLQFIDDDLYTAAVRFRLLREHGFNVYYEMFNKFIDEKGKFKESLIIDMKGMLELYEVAHFQLHGETILEEALAFTMFHLKATETTMDYPLSTQIANALKRPLHKSLPRWWKGLDVATNFPFIRDGLVECCF